MDADVAPPRRLCPSLPSLGEGRDSLTLFSRILGADESPESICLGRGGDSILESVYIAPILAPLTMDGKGEPIRFFIPHEITVNNVNASLA